MRPLRFVLQEEADDARERSANLDVHVMLATSLHLQLNVTV